MKKKEMEAELQRMDNLLSQLIDEKESNRKETVSQELRFKKLENLLENLINYIESKDGHLPDGISRKKKKEPEQK